MKLNLRDKITSLNCIYAAFILVELIIYVTFNALVAVRPADPIYLKYSGILLCLAVAAVFIYFYKIDGVVLTCALAFTALSDLFILVLDDYYEIGVTTFTIAQAVYLYRLYRGRFNRIYITLAVRATLAAATVIILAVCVGLNYLLFIVSVYFTMLCVNCADAFIICSRGFKDVLFAVGLLLFIGCDVCVGLHNFGPQLNVGLPQGVINFVQYAMWAFYLPSQVLIVCSAMSAKNGGQSERDKTVQAA